MGWNPCQLPQCERGVHPGQVWNLLQGFISLVNEKCFQPREHSSAYSLLRQTAQASKQNMFIAHHSLLMWRPEKQRSDEGSADTLSWSLQLDDGGVSIFILSVCKCFLLCWWIHDVMWSGMTVLFIYGVRQMPACVVALGPHCVLTLL